MNTLKYGVTEQGVVILLFTICGESRRVFKAPADNIPTEKEIKKFDKFDVQYTLDDKTYPTHPGIAMLLALLDDNQTPFRRLDGCRAISANDRNQLPRKTLDGSLIYRLTKILETTPESLLRTDVPLEDLSPAQRVTSHLYGFVITGSPAGFTVKKHGEAVTIFYEDEPLYRRTLTGKTLSLEDPSRPQYVDIKWDVTTFTLRTGHLPTKSVAVDPTKGNKVLMPNERLVNGVKSVIHREQKMLKLIRSMFN